MDEAHPEGGEALTPAQFVAMATDMMLAGFDEEFDIPELWGAVGGFPAEDVGHLHRHALANPPRSALVRGVHRHADDAWQMLAHLFAFHAGAAPPEALATFAASALARHSQSPLVAGYAYHVRRLLAPEPEAFDLREHVCETPFERLDVLERSAHLCCASWLHKSAGDLSSQSHEEVWNSEAAAAIRQSVLDGSYRYCNKVACPEIAGRRLPRKDDLARDPWWRAVIEGHLGAIDRAPRQVNLAYDRHCNLACPSCRTELITSDDADRERLDKITQRAIFPLLALAREALVTGSGDPFASRTFRKLLAWVSDATCPDLKLTLMTNGMLFTEREWEKFPNLRGKVGLVKVSMDGATRETHELLRRGSRWDVMQSNLRFIGSLLARGEIDAYELVFVVQQENYREMGDFVDLAARVGASRVYFERVTNWGTFSPEAYARKAVFSPAHPEHREFLVALADPRLRDPRVFLGSLAEFVARDAAPFVRPVAPDVSRELPAPLSP